MKLLSRFSIFALMLTICLSLATCDAKSTAAQTSPQQTTPASQGVALGTEKPEQEAESPHIVNETSAQANHPEENGKYRHEIDGVVFYTEHDVEQWIERRDEKFYPKIYLDRMVKDLFGDYAEGFRGQAVVPLGDPYHDTHAMAFVFGNAGFDGIPELQAKEGVYPYLLVDSTKVYDMGYGAEEEYYKPYYFFDDSYQCTEYEMIEMFLFECERWLNGDEKAFSFDIFKNTKRIVVYD